METGNVTRVWLPLAVGLVFIPLVFFSSGNPPNFLDWLGLALSMLGLAGVILSRYTLGQSFSVQARAVRLVTTGIYSRIRNPIYISGFLFGSGIFLIIHKPILLAFFAALIPVQIIRARREAAVLEARFGDEYRAWRKTTWF